MNIVKTIKRATAYAGLNDSNIADKLGVSRQAYSQRMKTGKFTDRELERIASAIGASASFILTMPDGTRITVDENDSSEAAAAIQKFKEQNPEYADADLETNSFLDMICQKKLIAVSNIPHLLMEAATMPESWTIIAHR